MGEQRDLGRQAEAPHMRIGAGARIAARAAVMCEIPAGETWGGYPAQEIRGALRDEAALRKLAGNVKPLLKLLKDAGLWIAGADAAGPQLAAQADLRGPLALVLGAEGAGLKDLTRRTCDLLVRLPQRGSVESLNVSVAAGMLLYEAVRQRTASGPPT